MSTRRASRSSPGLRDRLRRHAHGRRVHREQPERRRRVRLWLELPDRRRHRHRALLRPLTNTHLRTIEAAGQPAACNSGSTPGVGRTVSLKAALASVDAIADRTFAGWKVPGLAYGVTLGDRLIHSRGLGTLRVGTDAPPDADSVLRIASMTKSFTAATVLLLRDEGRLRLDDPIGGTYRSSRTSAARRPTRRRSRSGTSSR